MLKVSSQEIRGCIDTFCSLGFPQLLIPPPIPDLFAIHIYPHRKPIDRDCNMARTKTTLRPPPQSKKLPEFLGSHPRILGSLLYERILFRFRSKMEQLQKIISSSRKDNKKDQRFPNIFFKIPPHILAFTVVSFLPACSSMRLLVLDRQVLQSLSESQYFTRSLIGRCNLTSSHAAVAVPLELRPSPIHETGTFATRKIGRGEPLMVLSGTRAPIETLQDNDDHSFIFPKQCVCVKSHGSRDYMTRGYNQQYVLTPFHNGNDNRCLVHYSNHMCDDRFEGELFRLKKRRSNATVVSLPMVYESYNDMGIMIQNENKTSDESGSDDEWEEIGTKSKRIYVDRGARADVRAGSKANKTDEETVVTRDTWFRLCVPLLRHENERHYKPNPWHDDTTFTNFVMMLYAARTIEKDQEVTINYIHYNATTRGDLGKFNYHEPSSLTAKAMPSANCSYRTTRCNCGGYEGNEHYMSGELILGENLTGETKEDLATDWSSSEEEWYSDSDIDWDSLHHDGSVIAPVYSQPNKKKDR